MKRVVIYRNNYLDNQILGHLFVIEEDSDGGSRVIFECKTLELAWKNNQRHISCVTAGFYNLVYEWSPKFQRNLWEIKGTPERSEAKIHVANFYTELNGCIAVGDMHLYINDDDFLDVRNSSNTLERFHRAMGSDTKATIHIVGKA